MVSKYKDSWIGFDAEDLVNNMDNVLVTDEDHNYALFEYDEPGVYYGHYMFTGRGPSNTYKIAQNLLGFFFREFPAKTVMGLTPTEHKGALRLNKALGFKIDELVDTEAGPHFRVSINKEDFNYE